MKTLYYADVLNTCLSSCDISQYPTATKRARKENIVID